MRVAVVNLTSGGLSGGYRKYLQRAMPLLAADRRVQSLTIFLPEGAVVSLDPHLDIRTWPAGAGTGRAGLRRQVAEVSPDVVLVPTARHTDFGGLPMVPMVRNMEPLAVPFGGNPWMEAMKNLARAWEAQRACRRATRIIAVSEHVREFLVRRWHLDPQRIGVVYHGVDVMPVRREGAGYRGPRTLFTAGSIRPARGLEDAIRALARLTDATEDVQLVVAGRVDPGCEPYAARLRALARSLGVHSRLQWIGQVDAAVMTRHLRESVAFVMTSRAEACPNTVLEAMSCGTASVSVDHPPMPEFFGEAALYYPAGDAAALADRLRTLLQDSAAVHRLGTAASSRARGFTWSGTVDRTITELEKALDV
jgi:glycosyltransferase involved in cell wall biosynthesis